ncbi:MAG: FecR domain-containing protein [Bacteroidales bacterium]|nr:FecR domain-containing protein [Bacteroidales bacterium]
MEKRIEDLLRKATALGLDEKEQQEILSLFHQQNLEFKVKAELTDILDNIGITGEESGELRPLFEKIWKMISEKENKKKKKVFPVSSLLKVAASLLLGLVIGKMIFTGHINSEQFYYTSIAPKGSISQVVLPDSSYIYLNAGSTIKYAMNGNKGNREVFLDGEAWFRVQKSEKRPFIVHTHFYDVNVKGTEFNVKAYYEDADVVTTLEKGSVTITSGAVKLKEQAVLEPGEQLVYNKNDGSMVVKDINTRWATSWKENKLIFINMSFRELVVLLERKYGVDIQVAESEIMDFHYDGIIKDESIIKVLDLLRLTLPIDYKIKDQIIEIRRNK